MEKLRYPRQAKREQSSWMSDIWSRYEDTKMNKMQILALNCWFLPVQRWKQIVQRQLGCYECAIMVTCVWECRGDLGCIFRGDGVLSDIWSTVQVQHSKCKGLGEVICSAVWVRKNTVCMEASNSRIRWRQEQNLMLKRYWEARRHRYCMNFSFILTITSHGQILRKGVTWWDLKFRKINLISVAGPVGLPTKWWHWAT